MIAVTSTVAVAMADGTFTIEPNIDPPPLAALAAADAAEAQRRDPAALRQRLAFASTIGDILAVLGAATDLAEMLKETKAKKAARKRLKPKERAVELAADAAARTEIAEIVARAQRQGGLLLEQMVKRGEIGQVRDSGRRATFLDFGIDKRMRARMKARAAVPEDEFESRLAARRPVRAAGAKPVPLSSLKMRVTPWFADVDGTLTRYVYNSADEIEVPTTPSSGELIIPPAARGADMAAYQRQFSLWQWLGSKDDWVSVGDMAANTGQAVPAYAGMNPVYRERVLLRDVGRLVKLDLLETRMSKRRGRHAREVRRV
jgi:hypothetical protein